MTDKPMRIARVYTDRTRSPMEPLTIHDIRSQATKELYP